MEKPKEPIQPTLIIKQPEYTIGINERSMEVTNGR